MKCAGLKERWEWPEVGGPGPVVDKGKGKEKEKEVAMLLRGGEKRKKKKTMTTSLKYRGHLGNGLGLTLGRSWNSWTG